MPDLFNQNKYQPKNRSVFRLIHQFEEEYSDIFVKSKVQWLPSIREFLREETGLRMHQKVVGTKIQKDNNITFHFVADSEDNFIKLIDQNYPDLNFDEYSSFKRLHIELKNSDGFFNENSANPSKAYRELNDYLDTYFKKYDIQVLLNTLFKNSGQTADIWGTYSLKGRIEIYYVPLILFCKINNLPLEHGIISTLVHEMAHAYHHLGKDKDNVVWANMFDADDRIVEGMAEYFTWLFVETFKGQHPGMAKTYNCMSECLATEYTVFKSWTPLYSKEAIKSALLGTRKKSICDYDEFQILIQNVQKIMH